MRDYLKELSLEFGENLKLNYDLKKKIGSTLVAKQRSTIKLKI